MPRSSQNKAALITVLVAAAIFSSAMRPAPTVIMGHPQQFDWITLAVLAFGIINVLLELPGTQGTRSKLAPASGILVVRGISIVAAFAALVWPDIFLVGVIVLVGLVWPPAFLVTWAIERETDITLAVDAPTDSATSRRSRVAIAAIIGAVAIGSIAYRLIVLHRLEQSAALFIGVPVVVAMAVIFWVSPRSATGVACKAVTVGLLVSVLFLGEGFLCVVMSAPLFYVVAIALGLGIDYARRGFGKHPNTAFLCLVTLTFVPMSLEGVTGATSFNRDEWVSETKIVRASPGAIERAMLEPPRFDRVLPLYLRVGFPRPIATRLEPDATGTRMIIRFRGGEMRLDGIEPRIGDLTLALEEMRPGLIRWRAVGDESHMTHFLSWREARVEWKPVGADATRVTWALRYRRSLDPAWYFGPWERYATRLAAGYLIDAVATP